MMLRVWAWCCSRLLFAAPLQANGATHDGFKRLLVAAGIIIKGRDKRIVKQDRQVCL